MSTDRAWEQYGKDNPYFGVLSDERFRGASLSESALRDFYASGEEYVQETLAVCQRHFAAPARAKALDFGCGVGRLTIPLARYFESVTGIDVSQAMLDEARTSCKTLGVGNVRFCQNLAELAHEEGTFSFINSFIVLQHIEPTRGLNFIAAMLRLLGKGGHGAIHMTYAREKDRANLGIRPFGSKAIQAMRRPLSALQRMLMRRDPEMQMNAYPLNEVLFRLQDAGVQEVHTRFTDHGGHWGVLLFFVKP